MEKNKTLRHINSIHTNYYSTLDVIRKTKHWLLIDHGFDPFSSMVLGVFTNNYYIIEFIYYIYKIMSDLEISDDFGAFWRYLEQAPEMTIELDHRSILERNNRSMFISWHRSTAKRAESLFGHSRLEAQVFTNLQDYRWRVLT